MSDVFAKIESLAELLNEHDLVAIRLKEGDKEIELRRESDAPGVPVVGSAPRSVAAAAVGEAIPSPMVGVF
jgi:hypothetical protein